MGERGRTKAERESDGQFWFCGGAVWSEGGGACGLQPMRGLSVFEGRSLKVKLYVKEKMD